MENDAALPEEARAHVRRVVWLSRLAGVAIAAALALASLYIHRSHMDSLESMAQLATVATGLCSFVVLSTLARIGHTRVLERSLGEVQRLTEQLREIAESDPLTGLCNLRAFRDRLEEEIDRARAAGGEVTLIVADLDNFKLLNDAYGHQLGDQVLCQTARVFAERGGLGAHAARLGGDEFALVLPRASRSDAVRVAADIEAALRQVRIDERRPAALGSFGIGTYPSDGETAQALFAAADSRMYSEKHRRKAESVASLAGAARKLFVRVGRAMRPEHSTEEILREIAGAARDEFALSVCVVFVSPRGHHAPIAVAASEHRALEQACLAAAAEGAPDTASLSQLLPGEAWVIETPIPGELVEGGTLLLAGLPMISSRPDPQVLLALADLIQATVANGRAHVDAVRAGRERDIHIELGRALAGGGSLQHRLQEVTRMIADFIGVPSVSIEGLSATAHSAPAYNLASGAGPRFLREWEAARALEESRRFLESIAMEAPCIIEDPGHDARVPAAERRLLERAGVQSSAVCPIRFGGEVLGVVGAVSDEPQFFNDDLLDVLMTIADHLAPSVKVALLREELEASYERLQQASRESLARLADAAEARDPHTGGHLRRIRAYSVALALELGLSEAQAEAIGEASAVHDLGKLRLPDAVLMKPGSLDEDDWAQVRQHPQHGERLIGDSPMFEVERAVVRWHHERWDGSGYPDGLRGEAIPLPARIVAVADALDALTTERPYKHAWPLADGLAEIKRMKGKLFCPAVVGALESLHGRGELARIVESACEAERARAPLREAA